MEINWAFLAGFCSSSGIYGTECCRLTLPRPIADTAMIWGLDWLGWWVAMGSSPKDTHAADLNSVPKCTL
jgi:hypothetical protein